MSVSARMRFEVLARDGFACLYCGRKAPEVVLEVDHRTPVAIGGRDNSENLATACRDCNGGKSAGTLIGGGIRHPKRPPGIKKIPRNYRILEGLIKRMAAVRAPHEDETAFVECALHNEIMRREQEARRPAG